MKPTTPYGQLPVLFVDGEPLGQSNALVRYAGRLSGFYPDCPHDAVKVDEVLDTVYDFTNSVLRYGGSEQEAQHAERKRILEVDAPALIGVLEKRLAKFGDGPWAVGKKMTVADMVIFTLVTFIKSGFKEYVPPCVLDKYERVIASYEAVKKDPKVVEWYAAHPAQ